MIIGLGTDFWGTSIYVAPENMNQIDDINRMSGKAKVPANNGEFLKASATTVRRGVAPPTENIVDQLNQNSQCERIK